MRMLREIDDIESQLKPYRTSIVSFSRTSPTSSSNPAPAESTNKCQTLTPAPEESAYTHLIFRNRPQLAWCGSPPGGGADRDVDSLPDLSTSRDPVADLVRDDFDDGHAGVMAVALVHAVADVAEPRTGARRDATVSRNSYVDGRWTWTYAELQYFSIFSLSWEILAMPE